jgi:hypothetical protein
MSNPPPHPAPTSLLQTALLSSKLQAANISGSPKPRYARSSASSAAGDESDEDELVGVQTPSHSHGAMTPAMRSPQLGSALLADQQANPPGRVRSIEGRKREPKVVKLSSDPVRAFPSEISKLSTLFTRLLSSIQRHQLLLSSDIFLLPFPRRNRHQDLRPPRLQVARSMYSCLPAMVSLSNNQLW